MQDTRSTQQWWRYRRRSLSLTPAERRLLTELVPQLPARIVDAHTHCNLPEHVGLLPEEYRNLPLATFPHYTLHDGQYSRMLLWPDHQVTSLRFANAYRGIDHREANAYLLNNVEAYGDSFVCYGIPDDVSYTISLLEHPSTRALKMYYRYTAPPATNLAEFLPDAVVAKAADAAVPLVLHLPTPPAQSAEELIRILGRHPDLRAVLAHVGTVRPGSAEDLDALGELSRFAGVAVDTALVMNSELIAQALALFGPGRVVFGTDEPLSLISAAEYEHPTKGKQWVSALSYHWLDETDAVAYAGHARTEMLLHFSQIAALHDAIDRLFQGANRQKALEEVFHGAASRLFALQHRG